MAWAQAYVPAYRHTRGRILATVGETLPPGLENRGFLHQDPETSFPQDFLPTRKFRPARGKG